MSHEAAEAQVYNSSYDAMAYLPSTFEAFFHDHRDRLFGLLCLITGDRSDAEELAQEAFLKMWERWADVDSIVDPVAYLHRIALNEFRKRQRRASIGRRLTGRPVDHVSSSAEPSLLLDEALRALTPRQRAALVLTELLGYSAEEASKMLGVKRSTVGALKYQGRAALKQGTELSDE